MPSTVLRCLFPVLASAVVAACSTAPTQADSALSAPPAGHYPDVCQQFGPQTPRDIDARVGSNHRVFSFAPDYQQLNLCNLHLHHNAEHKAQDFSIYAGSAKEEGDGFRCNISTSLSDAEQRAPQGGICNGLKPGDTVEVHWVYSACDVQPGPTLDACSSASCANPQLRVEAQVFTLVNDPNSLDFSEFDSAESVVDAYHQAKSLPQGTGTPVQYLGSTTGASYNDKLCSPLQVSWSVRPKCAKLDINSLGRWCQHNVFDEHHAHGVRKLVTNPQLLSEIRKGPRGSD